MSEDFINDYRARRSGRLSQRKGPDNQEHDHVKAFRDRREERLDARFDANPRLAYGIAKSMGIKTEGMSPKEVWEAIKEKKGGSASSGGGLPKKGKPSKDAVSGRMKVKSAPGDVRTGKTGKLRPKHDAAKRIDTKDAFEESQRLAAQGRKNSLSDYMDEKGNLKPERQAVHDQIIKNFFANKVPYQGQGTLIMSGGGPASGKTFVKNDAEGKFGAETTVTIDPDAFKSMLPGYADMAKKDKGAAAFYHEESSALAKRAYQFAADNGLNVVYDGTGDGSVGSVLKKLKTAQEAGYKVRGAYVTVDTEEALRRNQARYEHMANKYESGESDIPPRLPPEEDVRKIHAAVSDISIKVAAQFDDFELWDNNVKRGEKPVLIAKATKGGGIKAVKGHEEQLQRYLNKGHSGAKVVNGAVVFE